MSRKPMKTSSMGAMSVYGKSSPVGGWPGYDQATPASVASTIPSKTSPASGSMHDGPYGGKKPQG